MGCGREDTGTHAAPLMPFIVEKKEERGEREKGEREKGEREGIVRGQCWTGPFSLPSCDGGGEWEGSCLSLFCCWS